MIYITKFRANDLNPSKGKQIEFNKNVVEKFFMFASDIEDAEFECCSIENRNNAIQIKVTFKLSPSRGDYKIYQNADGSEDLKDFFLNTLHLTSERNLNDFYAIKKLSDSKYQLFYIPSNLVFSNFFNCISSDQILFVDNSKQEVSPSVREIVYGNPFINALHTKPFLLLAGISGTGKSQKVQELAFMTCTKELREDGKTMPGNYCLVEVKPNWHDSTELLGYYSALTGKYELTDFIRFVYKATQHRDVPFFLCLDEMNLAPVEQYFAEYLSVLETRKKVGDRIITQPLLSKERFANCELSEKELVKKKGYDILDGENDYIEKPLYTPDDAEIIRYLKDNGLSLPDNLFVVGTVNMDDTTHQFSRKVIDRAFTIEMNGGRMEDMFREESRALLEYRDEPVPLVVFKSEFVRANEVLDDEHYARYVDVIKKEIPALLGNSDGTADEDSINGILNGTPFRVSYRVQNELVLYLSVLMEQASFPEYITNLIGEATLAILLEKILPRVQGEQKQLETKHGQSNVLKDLKAFVESHFAPHEGTDSTLFNNVISKLNEMDKKLESYYTNFF